MYVKFLRINYLLENVGGVYKMKLLRKAIPWLVVIWMFTYFLKWMVDLAQLIYERSVFWSINCIALLLTIVILFTVSLIIDRMINHD